MLNYSTGSNLTKCNFFSFHKLVRLVELWNWSISWTDLLIWFRFVSRTRPPRTISSKMWWISKELKMRSSSQTFWYRSSSAWTNTCIRSRIPSSFSEESAAKMNERVAYFRYINCTSEGKYTQLGGICRKLHISGLRHDTSWWRSWIISFWCVFVRSV